MQASDDQVKKLVQADSAFIGFSSSDVRVTRLKQAFRNSVFKIQSINETVFLKFINAEPDSTVSLFDRYKELEARGSALRFAKAIFANPETGAFYTEWLDGNSLTSLVWGKGPHKDLQNAMHEAGRWIGEFHKTVCKGEQSFKCSEKFSLVADYISDAPTVCKNAYSRLKGCSAKLDSEQTIMAIGHGDYKPDNVMIEYSAEPNKQFTASGIDLELKYQTSVVYDLAAFLVNLRIQLIRKNPITAGRMFTIYREQFLTGYADTSGYTLSVRQLNWAYVFTLLRHTIADSQQSKGVLGAIKVFVLRYLLGKDLAILTAK